MKTARVELAPRTMLGVHEVARMDALTEFMGRAFSTSASELGRQGAAPAGPAIAMYNGMPTDIIDVTAGFPVVQPVESSPDAVVVTLPGGPAIEAIHIGPYETMSQTYTELMSCVAEQKLATSETMWEEYLVGPDIEPDPAKWQTRIVFPLA